MKKQKVCKNCGADTACKHTRCSCCGCCIKCGHYLVGEPVVYPPYYVQPQPLYWPAGNPLPVIISTTPNAGIGTATTPNIGNGVIYANGPQVTFSGGPGNTGAVTN
jgi:hypothetical protein